MSDEIAITHNLENERYEARIDGELVGFAAYRASPRQVIFTHTEVFPDWQGQGVASALARAALEDIQSDGQRRVVPLCPYIKGWIDRHREFQPLVSGVTATTQATRERS